MSEIACILNFSSTWPCKQTQGPIRGPPTVRLIHCDNCCTCAEQKYKQLSITQRSLQSVQRLGLFIVRNQGRNEGWQPDNCSFSNFQKIA